MTKDDILSFLKILSRRGMYVDDHNLDEFFGFVAGFDAACELSILKDFRAWLLIKYPQANGPFGWPTLVRQILPDDLEGKEAVDAFVDILQLFLAETHKTTDVT
ncbi:hypothetical protein KX729_14585 [Rhizobium sp. XQZ8]|uniref:hypothetical protein n=1 Tax=Rhizobium populisoli TaxID=2859785 RepID=UPI001CA5DC87|nr:hypothetical protein [Rhizobium populisoli]MBW6422681.1 hypothetical protein [Rhizobium populisoli]